MSRRFRLFRLLGSAGLLALLGAGCSGDDDEAPSPTEQCNEVARTECHRIFVCTTDAERTAAGLPPGLTEAGCILALAAQVGCETATADKICAGTASYTAANAQACISEANKAECATIKAN